MREKTSIDSYSNTVNTIQIYELQFKSCQVWIVFCHNFRVPIRINQSFSFSALWIVQIDKFHVILNSKLFCFFSRSYSIEGKRKVEDLAKQLSSMRDKLDSKNRALDDKAKELKTEKEKLVCINVEKWKKQKNSEMICYKDERLSLLYSMI